MRLALFPGLHAFLLRFRIVVMRRTADLVNDPTDCHFENLRSPPPVPTFRYLFLAP